MKLTEAQAKAMMANGGKIPDDVFKALLAKAGRPDPKAGFEALREDRLRSGDFDGYLRMFGSHERLQPFLKIIPRLSDEQFWKLLGQVWMDAEVISPDQKIWLRLFRSKRPSREALMTKDEWKTLAALPEKLKIWRGYGDEGGVRGMSWTTDRARAEFFASYSCDGRRAILTSLAGHRPTVAAATCQKSKVLAFFCERKESEVVIGPADVKVERTWRLPPNPSNSQSGAQ